jgi:hypothetical protein
MFNLFKKKKNLPANQEVQSFVPEPIVQEPIVQELEELKQVSELEIEEAITELSQKYIPTFTKRKRGRPIGSKIKYATKPPKTKRFRQSPKKLLKEISQIFSLMDEGLTNVQILKQTNFKIHKIRKVRTLYNKERGIESTMPNRKKQTTKFAKTKVAKKITGNIKIPQDVLQNILDVMYENDQSISKKELQHFVIVSIMEKLKHKQFVVEYKHTSHYTKQYVRCFDKEEALMVCEKLLKKNEVKEVFILQVMESKKMKLDIIED